MYNIAIGIPTYKRPILLRKLLLSIFECNINRSLINNIRIIILDNDSERTAETIVNELETRFDDIYKLHYYNHPIKGLSIVRNEIIKKALILRSDFLVFIDDDEYPSAEWLSELLKTIVNNDGDIAMGPVISVFDNKVSKYISCWFERPSHLADAKINYIRTGNLIIRADSLTRLKVWFDNRFNRSGSEDSYFGVQMRDKGATIYWAANALVYENVPKNRANIKWLLERTYRNSSTFSYVLKLEKRNLRMLKKILTSFIYIIIGTCASIMMIVPIKKKYWGILKVSGGIGGLTGLFSIKYKDYK
jgi:succinoglycan biosynthesis protein ExoM